MFNRKKINALERKIQTLEKDVSFWRGKCLKMYLDNKLQSVKPKYNVGDFVGVNKKWIVVTRNITEYHSSTLLMIGLEFFLNKSKKTKRDDLYSAVLYKYGLLNVETRELCEKYEFEIKNIQ